jgi:23S rRNA pseudouridine1911/1915/1917 synthase
MRLDLYLTRHFPAISRTAIQRLMEEGCVLVDGKRVKPTHVPHAGEVVAVTFPEVRQAAYAPEDIPLQILHEDGHLLVINKQPQLAVHPGAGRESNTLVNALLHHCAGSLSGIGGVARPGIVHRLDIDTTGCLVVAKTDAVHAALSAQFAARKVEKIYYAILCGELPNADGVIRARIARHATRRKLMTVDEDRGREAHTSFWVEQRLRASTLVRVRLHTGRTHQIRVHFQHIGFPLVGDLVYGKKQNQRLKELTNYAAPRQMLHARQLSFVHPHTGERMEFEAAWPEDFQDALKALART